MAHGEVSAIIPASCQEVFDVLHDYACRLEWDTLLQAAYLEGDAKVAAKGVTSVCVGRRGLGGVALKAIYVTFERPVLAAVKMVNEPPFFKAWAASIHHEEISAHESRITYKFQFTTKPRALQFILDPVMKWLFLWETRKRLHALRGFFLRGAG